MGKATPLRHSLAAQARLAACGLAVWACVLLWALSAPAAWAATVRVEGSSPLTVAVTISCPDEADAPTCALGRRLLDDLGRTPRGHGLAVTTSTASGGSVDWSDESNVLAELDVPPPSVDGGEGATDGRGASSLAVRLARSGDRVSPGWLVHAALRGAEAAGRPAIVEPGIAGPFCQLAARWTGQADNPAVGALAAGIPAIRLPGWPASPVAAVVRRLDGLEGRPIGEDAYLVLGGRVWLRRDLYWVGLLLWIASLVRRLPGAWRGRGAAARRREGRRYLGGLAFRALFLAGWLVAPVEAALLLYPAALVSLVSVAGRGRHRALTLAGLLPAGALLAELARRVVLGGAALRVPWGTALLVAAALVAFAWRHEGRSRAPRRPAVAPS